MVMIATEVEVDLTEFTTEELLDELESREFIKYPSRIANPDLNNLYETKKYRPEKFDELFREFCWKVLGKNI